HRPKYEKLGATTFVILRAVDEKAPPHADTTQKLTRKVALFFNKELLITVHRAEMPFLEGLKAAARSVPPAGVGACAPHVLAVANGVIDTYWKPLDDAETLVSNLEDRQVGFKDRRHVIRQTFALKRRLNALRITSRHILETVKRMAGSTEDHLPHSPFLNDLKENAETLYFATDEIMEDVNNLLNLELAAADHDTNEVMRVLTVFSAFFLPLTFIVGVYGMNFDVMPELRWAFGYPVVLASMAVVCVAIYLWFHRKGWM
ncbi:MAG TPA: CorA family divalent cation transporter, partial [Vicinamibacteria bacterium]